MINYVTNLPPDLRSGGFSSINLATYGALHDELDVHYVGPINPPSLYREKIPSKLRRMTGFPGDFAFFSERRLSTIAHEVNARCRPAAVLDFFHGFTPWILTRPERPYVSLSDCTFRDYVEVFHRRADFSDRDLARIETAEAEWLKRASAVILLSRWAADRAIRDYALDPAKVHVVNGCGEIEMPDADEFQGGLHFVFVSTNFQAKGGDVVLAAFRKVRQQYPDASLTIVGDRPDGMGSEAGIQIAGFLRKEVPEDVKRFRTILSGARALIHPTESDVAPLILLEAGYFGCPGIASRRFAIPEIIDDGESGLLLDEPANPAAVANAMLWTIESGDAYSRMRRQAWARARTERSRSQFESRIVECVRATLEAAAALPR